MVEVTNMDRLCCLISGGHIYENGDRSVFKDMRNANYVFKRYCRKCGRAKRYIVPISSLPAFTELPPLSYLDKIGDFHG